MSDLFSYDNTNTPIDESERLDLIPSLSTRSELNEFEFENISEARAWAMSPRRLKNLEPFDEPFLRELHHRMFKKVWKWAGKYRQTEKTIGVTPARIQSDLSGLLGDARYWVQNSTFPPLEIAARFHHRLVLIHPFCNGNGRHSRLISDVVALKYWNLQLGWGVGTGEYGDIRSRYIQALRAADQLSYDQIIAFAGSGTL